MNAEVAEPNMASVGRLFMQLTQIASARGITHENIADATGWGTPNVDDALAGNVDLTLSDLQELAIAIGARLSFVAWHA